MTGQQSLNRCPESFRNLLDTTKLVIELGDGIHCTDFVIDILTNNAVDGLCIDHF